MYNSFSGTRNNMDHLDPVSRLKMKRDQELNAPNFVKSVEQNIEQYQNSNQANTNLPVMNPTINGIPNKLPRNQNIMMQPKCTIIHKIIFKDLLIQIKIFQL